MAPHGQIIGDDAWLEFRNVQGEFRAQPVETPEVTTLSF